MTDYRQHRPDANRTVETVKGPVDVSDLGRTLMHEHIFGLSPEIIWNWPDVPGGWNEDEQVETATAKLDAVHRGGFGALVDLTVIGLGRYLPPVQRVADRTDLHIIAATGVYATDDLPGFFAYRGPGAIFDKSEPMTPLFIRDIVEGIGDTGVRAGILKCATDRAGLTPGVERSLRAVAQAHRETGVPITTHTHAASRRGLDQQRIFDAEGVDLSRVVIGHCGDTTDLGYLERLVDAGSYIGMDRFGVEDIASFADRVDTVANLCLRGHADRIVLSHDAYCFSDRIDPDMQRAKYPNYHLLHISQDVIPALRHRGVTDEQITTMLEDNPRTILGRDDPY